MNPPDQASANTASVSASDPIPPRGDMTLAIEAGIRAAWFLGDDALASRLIDVHFITAS